MKHVIAYWLVPDEPARKFFTEMIIELAARFDAPVFEPHLTVFLAPEKSHSPSDVVAQLGTMAIRLTAIEIAASEEFTKALFVRFAATSALQELSDTMAKLGGTPARPLADPHVSLLYKYLPAQTKREVAASISLPFREVTFLSVRAMSCASPSASAEDVRAWRLLADQNSKIR